LKIQEEILTDFFELMAANQRSIDDYEVQSKQIRQDLHRHFPFSILNWASAPHIPVYQGTE
jgi:hypothetical protein